MDDWGVPPILGNPDVLNGDYKSTYDWATSPCMTFQEYCECIMGDHGKSWEIFRQLHVMNGVPENGMNMD